MKILAIETSCDETAIAVLEISNSEKGTSVKIISNQLLSQIKIHEQYGGVFPMIAKREHAKALPKLLEKVLVELSPSEDSTKPISEDAVKEVETVLEREGGLAKELIEIIEKNKTPEIDAIAVTVGPGLEPALWVGINFAKALGLMWQKPLIPVNHMEGHILVALLQESGEGISNDQFPISKEKRTSNYHLPPTTFPIISLLISGGHTEIVLMKNWGEYEIIGQTRDDAVGEAFDKVARMLGLPYPGGPQISKLAEEMRENKKYSGEIKLPRPMMHTDDFDFSFSGLKTAVLYKIKNTPELTEEIKKQIALEFENSACDVLVEKTKRAIEKYGAKTLVVGGGVSANKHIRRELENMALNVFSDVKIFLPTPSMSTDNAVMIGLVASTKFEKYKNSTSDKEMIANGNLNF